VAFTAGRPVVRRAATRRLDRRSSLGRVPVQSSDRALFIYRRSDSAPMQDS